MKPLNNTRDDSTRKELMRSPGIEEEEDLSREEFISQ